MNLELNKHITDVTCDTWQSNFQEEKVVELKLHAVCCLPWNLLACS